MGRKQGEGCYCTRTRFEFNHILTYLTLIPENGRYYLEYSSELAETVIQSHRTGEADRIFTQKFVPVSFTIEQNQVSEEEFETILFGYMLQFGINNVRGGKYTDLIWTHEQYNTIKTNIGTV